MFPEFSAFQAEVKDKVFNTEEGLRFPSTAVLTFISPDGHQVSKRTLGYIEPAAVFQKIREGEAVILDQCYVEDFSLEDYRLDGGLDSKASVEIRGFSARGAFFNNKRPLDLGYADFRGGPVSFAGSHFVKGSISMHASVIREGGLNMSDAVLPAGHLDFYHLRVESGDISFKNAVFGPGHIDFQDADFGSGETNFINTEFGKGEVNFVNTRFGDGNVSFKIARFGSGKVDFHYAKFGQGNISFERCDFGEGRVDFRTVEFGSGRVNFNRAVFGNGDVSFEASQLAEGKISFTRTQFGAGVIDFELAEFDQADASFNRTIFGTGNISFREASFRNLSLRSCHLDHYVDLRMAQCEALDLSDTIVRDVVDLMPYEKDLDIKTIDIHGMRLIGRIFIDWGRNRVKQLIRHQPHSSKAQKAEQYRTLKENFNVTGRYNDEDKAYLEFKRFESRWILEETVRRHPVSAIWMYPLYWFKLIVFDWIGHYATNPVRVIISMLIIYTVYSFIFAGLTHFTPAGIVSSLGDPDQLSLITKSFYHCAITFLTIGYGDYYPSGSIRWFSSIVGFTGLFLMSYFTVAFVRKILR